LQTAYIKKSGKILLNVNETLFANLIMFTTGGLEVFYENFQKSERFQRLLEETIRQETIYNVLSRFKMIEN
jgi:hypothetical protein